VFEQVGGFSYFWAIVREGCPKFVCVAVVGLSLFYLCSVDILIIYDTKRMHPDLLNTYINQIHMNIKLNSIYKSNGRINFLDLHIIRKTSNLKIDIF
jgi:hypothetical protein